MESGRPVRQPLWKSRREDAGGLASVVATGNESRVWIPEMDGLWDWVLTDIWKVREVGR